jgi:ribose-phosphate pyrophosphokinase
MVVVQSTYPPVDSNLIHALSLIAKAKEMSTEVYAVIPYMGYAKQDEEFLSREIVTMSVVASLFKAVGATKLIVVDIHSTIGLNYFRIPRKNLSAVPLLAKYFQKINLKEPLVVSPDLFWAKKAKEFAKLLGTKSIALNKQRDRKTGKLIIKSARPKSLKGQDVILLDDMVSSGGSIIKAIKFLKREYCGKIYVACTHAVLAGDAAKKIRNAGVSKIVSTNSIPRKTNIVDISGIISNAIKNW